MIPIINEVDEGATVDTVVGLTASATDPSGGTVAYSLTDDPVADSRSTPAVARSPWPALRCSVSRALPATTSPSKPVTVC